MKGKSCALLISAGMLALLPVLLLTHTLYASSTPDCPSCEKFGVTRFQEKRTASPFSLKRADGTPFHFDEIKGKPTLLFVWASYCEACKEDFPLFEKFSAEKKERLIVLTMVIDGENEKRVQRAIKNTKITLPVLLDIKEKVAWSYGVRMVPTTLLISQEGSVVGMVVGQRDWSLPEAWSAVKEIFSLR